jgi:CRISPR-associated protein Csb2
MGTLDKTLILDAFVAIARTARAYVIWDEVMLTTDECQVLERACSGIGYLGRAESWCEIRAVDAVPVDDDMKLVDLAARASDDGASSRRLGVAADCRGSGLLSALRQPTSAMRQGRRLQPPGAAWLEYRFPAGFGLTPSVETRAERSRSVPLPAGGSLRFVLEGRNESLRPPITETLAVAETFRAAAMKRYSAIADGETAPPALSGKADERPLAGHEHAFFLPRDLDGDGRIDHVDVWFKAGACHLTYRAVRSVSKLWDWRLGDQETYATTYLGAAQPATSRVWRSSTAFLLGAHPRNEGSPARRLRYAPETQLVRSLEEHGFPTPRTVSFWESPAVLQHERGGATTIAGFRSYRKGDRVIGKPFGVTIEFDTEQQGPIAIGRYAHFGMGQFVPDG